MVWHLADCPMLSHPKCRMLENRQACAVCRAAAAIHMYLSCILHLGAGLISLLQLTAPLCVMARMTHAIEQHQPGESLFAVLLTCELACHLYGLQHLSRCDNASLPPQMELPLSLGSLVQTRQRAMLVQGEQDTPVYNRPRRPHPRMRKCVPRGLLVL